MVTRNPRMFQNIRYILFLLALLVSNYLTYIYNTSNGIDLSEQPNSIVSQTYDYQMHSTKPINSVINKELYEVGKIPVPSVLLPIKGGLGNQLFEYACTYALARKHNWPLYVLLPPNQNSSQKLAETDRVFELYNFNIPLFNWNTVVDPTQLPLILPESNVQFINDSHVLSGSYRKDKALIHSSFCQSEFFFASYKSEIMEMFKLKVLPEISNSKVEKWIDKIRSSEESVAVHIRRGDFKDVNRVPISYQKQAMINITKLLKVPATFFVFSDDIDYVKENLLIATNSGKKIDVLENFDIHFVSADGLRSVDEFYLMSKCKHDIIPNSSFSWWAAYLNSYKKKIVFSALHNDKFFESIFPSPDQQLYNKWQFRYIYYPYDWNKFDPFL